MKPDTWTKSSRSLTDSSCVEVQWRKSSLSTDITTCVEVGRVKKNRTNDEKVTDEA